MPKKNQIEEECEDCYPSEVSAELLAEITGRKVTEILSYRDSGVITSVIKEKGTAWQMERFHLEECLKKIKANEKAEEPTKKAEKA